VLPVNDDRILYPEALKDPAMRKEFDALVRRILASRFFRGDQLPAFLKILIEYWEKGKNPIQSEIESRIWGKMGSQGPNAINALMGRLRNALKSFYASDGKSDWIEISVPVTEGGTRTKWIEIRRITPTPVLRPEQEREPLQETLRAWWARLGLALLIVVAVSGLVWVAIRVIRDQTSAGNGPVQSRSSGTTCDSSIAFTNLKDHDDVYDEKFYLLAKRTGKAPAGCFDYVIVEAIKLSQKYVQGRLEGGEEPSLSIHIGDGNTPSGTQFAVYIWSTSADLPPGRIDANYSPPPDLRQSNLIVVTRKRK
jgi:hypothetical protein